MSINIGNKKIRKLYKGDQLITDMYKGDELIYEDFEAKYGFRFTVDTTLTTSGAHTSSAKTISIRNYGNGTQPGWKVDWGDGTITTGGPNSHTHTYSTHGTYQILVLPNSFDSQGKPRKWWLSGGVQINEAEKMISIDTPYPKDSFSVGRYQSESIWSADGLSRMFSNTYNLASIPEDLLDTVRVVSVSTASGYGVFESTFFNCGSNTSLGAQVFTIAKKIFQSTLPVLSGNWCRKAFKQTFKGSSAIGIPAGLFDGINTSGITDFSEMFYETFYGNQGTIPSGLLDDIDTSSGTNFSNMFYGTFRSMTKTTVPAGLLDFLNTSNGTTFSYMFFATFASVGNDLTSGSLPAGLYAHVDTSSGTKLDYMFGLSGTAFYNSTDQTIPADLYPTVDLSSAQRIEYMFTSAFGGVGHSNPNFKLPERLFRFTGGNSVLRCERMFATCFNASFDGCTGDPLPQELIYGLSLPNCTNFSYMFYQAFRNSSLKYVDTISDGLFLVSNTTNGTDFTSMFQQTFENCKIKNGTGIPSALFSTIDTTNGTTFTNMFQGMFNYPTAGYYGGIPSGLFDTIKTPNGRYFSGMFSSTFRMISCRTGTIPAGLFDEIVTTNGTDFSSMFSSTFYAAFRQYNATSPGYGSTTAKIPAGLFDSIDITYATYVSSMFASTFEKLSLCTDSDIIPSGLFATIDTAGKTNLSSMFHSTFSFVSLTRGLTIPSNLFSAIDLSSATNCSGMFQFTFSETVPDTIPQGLFGFSMNTNNITTTNMFNGTFRKTESTAVYITYHGTLTDVFDGMSSFSWATAANVNSCLYQMFYYGGAGTTTANAQLNGTANDVLQHFNFAPTNDTNMFAGQTLLTDYATINTNWK